MNRYGRSVNGRYRLPIYFAFATSAGGSLCAGAGSHEQILLSEGTRCAVDERYIDSTRNRGSRGRTERPPAATEESVGRRQELTHRLAVDHRHVSETAKPKVAERNRAGEESRV